MKKILVILQVLFFVNCLFAGSVDLLEREKNILRREEELKKEEENLRLLKREIEEKIKKYSEILSRIEMLNERIEKRIESFKDNNINVLVKIYSNMPAKDAAQRLAQLDEETAGKIIIKMSQRNASEILANMEPSRAVAITKFLTQFEKKIPTK